MKKILIILALVLTGFGVYDLYLNRTSDVYAKNYGNITVNFHSTLPKNTIFDITNFLPGQTVNKNIDVKNTGESKTEVFVNGDKKGESGNPKLENILEIKIKEGNNVLYNKKLNKFLDDDKISLGKFNKNQSKTFNIEVIFPQSAGNEYQGKSVKFNLYFSENDKHDDRHEKENEDRDRDENENGFGSRFKRFFKFSKR